VKSLICYTDLSRPDAKGMVTASGVLDYRHAVLCNLLSSYQMHSGDWT